MTKIIAIDPGKTGGMALMSPGKVIELIDTPILGDDYNYTAIFDQLQDWKLQGADLAFIEFQQGKMAKSNKEGAEKEGRTSARNMISVGVGVGMWRMGFAACKIAKLDVMPHVWTKKVGLPKDATKVQHCQLAAQLFPESAHLFYGVRGGVKDGRADAVLIGEAFYRIRFKEQVAA